MLEHLTEALAGVLAAAIAMKKLPSLASLIHVLPDMFCFGLPSGRAICGKAARRYENIIVINSRIMRSVMRLSYNFLRF